MPCPLTSEHFYAMLDTKNLQKSSFFQAQNLKSIGFYWITLSELTWCSRHAYSGPPLTIPNSPVPYTY